MLIGLLAVLSASAAAGMRIGLPLLLLGLLQNEILWSKVPVLWRIHPLVLLCIFTSWSLFELFASKQLLGQRVLQIIQLIFSPFVGCLLAVSMAKIVELDAYPLWLVGMTGGLLALTLQLVMVGWFFRLQGLPLWVIFIEDLLCVFLVLLAFNSPQEGGVIAMLLFWLALRSSKEWYQWHRQQPKMRV
jgi:hypothetical protein